MKRVFRPSARHGFTIVELIVVIAVIAILAGIAIVSYSGWRTSTRQAQVKSELNAIAGYMETNRNFGTGYPADLSGFSGSPDVTKSGGSQDGGKTYCVDAESAADTNIKFYIDNSIAANGPKEGDCASRTVSNAPSAPSGVVLGVATGSEIPLTWTGSGTATSYTAQCASDAAFIYGLQSSTVTTTTTTVSGLSTGTTTYCRVKATNSNGSSAWSSVATTDTAALYGSLPVGTSIDGYWTEAPEGFLLEDGSAVSRAVYSDLFALIGTTYGSGNGSTTFNLPDSRGRTSVNRNPSDAEFATIGQVTGSKTEQLTIAQMPSHNHGQYTGTRDDGNFSGWSFTGYPQYPPGDGPGVGLWPLQTGYTGGDDAHNNIQPSIVKMSAIKYKPADPSAPTLPVATSISGYWSSAPSGYRAEDGTAVSRSTYADLFAAVGTTYGSGDGSTTFNLPDSRGRASVNISSSDSEFNSMGEKYGTKTETLTIAQLPNHTHTMYVGQPDDQNFTNGANQYPPGDGPGTNNTGITTTATGGGGLHNNIQPSITKMYAIKTTPATSGASGDVAVGTSIATYASSSTAPTGYLIENGAAVSRTTYANLFALIGTTYGSGDGSTTFNLPDSRGRVSVNRNPTDSQFNTMGEKYGEKTHILTIAEMPSHNHGQYHGGADDKNFTSGAGQVPPGDGPGQYSQAHVFMSTGSDQAHNEIQPSIVKRYFIKY